MPIVIWDVWVTIDLETLYPQVICNMFEEMRQKHSCTGSLWDNISTAEIIEWKVFEVQRENLQSSLNEE